MPTASAAVELYPIFTTLTVEFQNPSTLALSLPGEETNVVFTLESSNMVLTRGMILRLNLPEFINSTVTVASSQAGGTEILDDSSLIWESNTTLAIGISSNPSSTTAVPLNTLEAAIPFVITISGLSIPDGGVIEGDSAFTVDVVYPQTEDISTAVSFTTVEGIVSIVDPIIAFSGVSSFFISNITTSFYSSNTFAIGDIINIIIPGVDSSAASVDVLSSCTFTGLTASAATWTLATTTLSITLSGAVDPLTGLVIEVEDAALTLPSTGIEDGYTGTISIVDLGTGTTVATDATVAIPCWGICSASFAVSSGVGRAGFVNQYQFQMTTGGTSAVRHGDVITLTLTGFSAPDGSFFSRINGTETYFTVSWDEANTQLSMTLTNSTTAETSIDIIIPRERGLIAPTTGIRSSTAFALDWDQHTDYGSLSIATTTLLSVPAIGYISSSTIDYSPLIPGSNTALVVTVTLLDDFVVGDAIVVYLRDFVIPPQALQHTATAGGVSTGCCLSVGNTATSVADATIVITNTHTDITGGDIMIFTYTLYEGIQLPTAGVSPSVVDYNPRLAIVSTATSVATLIFSTVQYVQSFAPASFAATMLDAGNPSLDFNFTLHIADFELDPGILAKFL